MYKGCHNLHRLWDWHTVVYKFGSYSDKRTSVEHKRTLCHLDEHNVTTNTASGKSFGIAFFVNAEKLASWQLAECYRT